MAVATSAPDCGLCAHPFTTHPNAGKCQRPRCPCDLYCTHLVPGPAFPCECGHRLDEHGVGGHCDRCDCPRSNPPRHVDVPAPVDPASLDPALVAIDQGRAEPEPKVTPDRACTSCGAPIAFVRTPSGKTTPTNPDGTPHWGTCSSPAKHRKPRAKKAAPPGRCEARNPTTGDRCEIVGDHTVHMSPSPPLAARLDADLVHTRAMFEQAGLTDSLSSPPGNPGAISRPAGAGLSPAPATSTGQGSLPERTTGLLASSTRDVPVPAGPPSILPAPASSALPSGGAGASSGSMGAAAVVPPETGPAAAPQNLPARAATYYDFAADAMQALEQAEADIAFEDEAREQPVFHIQTREHLEWYVRLMTELAAARARVREQAERMEAQLEGQLRYLARRFAPEAQPVVDELLAQSKPKKRSVDLFAGRIGYRTTAGAPTVADRAATTAWALEQEDAEAFGKYAYNLDARKVIAHVKATAEPVPGVEFREPRESMYLEAGGARLDLTELAAPPAIESQEGRDGD